MKNKYQISISGLNLHQVVAFFERENFHVENLSKQNNSLITVTLPKVEFEKLTKSDFAKSFKIKIEKKIGRDTLLQSCLKHFGLFLGFSVCVCFIFFSTNHIHSVKIDTTNHVCENHDECIFKDENKEKLEKELAKLGVKEGSKLPIKLSSREIERCLVQNFKQISGVTILQNGVNVEVQIQEGKLKEGETVFSLKSPVSGIVVTNNVVSGNCLVKNGDIVLEGQVLATPKDNKKVTATFEIRTFFHENLVFSETQTSYVRTGKKQTINTLELFNHKFGKDEKCSFKLFESETKKRYAFFNLFLPFKTCSTTFFELEKQEKKLSFSDVEEQLKQQLLEKTQKLVPPSAIQRNTTFSTFRENDKVRLDCYIECLLTVTT